MAPILPLLCCLFLPPGTEAPLDTAGAGDARPAGDVEAPLDRGSATADPPETPLGDGPATGAEDRPPDPKKTNVVRASLQFGPVWRMRRADTLIGTDVGFGRMHGFSGVFHTSFLIGSDRDVVRVLDVPIGVGAVLRGRTRNRPFFGSVGLTAGIMVHRAASDDGLIHRVDPDFRLPIRFAWTASKRGSGIGVSVSVVQGYSVRSRAYERRGVEVWSRDAYRVALLVGLHWDQVPGQKRPRRKRRREGRSN